jgi:hypothetical protein
MPRTPRVKEIRKESHQDVSLAKEDEGSGSGKLF